MNRAAPPNKGTPPMAGRGRKSETQKQNYSESLSAATFPFRRDGFDHELIESTGLLCLAARSKSGRQAHFEVVVLQYRKPRILPNGDFLPEGWVYPASAQWGEAGWTYGDSAKHAAVA
jgi:hypothetical protein